MSDHDADQDAEQPTHTPTTVQCHECGLIIHPHERERDLCHECERDIYLDCHDSNEPEAKAWILKMQARASSQQG